MPSLSITDTFKQLEKLNWINTDTRKLIADNGCALSIGTEFHAHHDKETVQVTLNLFKGDKKVWGWGSESNEQNDVIVKWFYGLYNKTTNAKFHRDDVEVNELKKALFA